VTVIAACDPSSIKCGYAVIRSSGQRLTYIAAGVIDAGSKRPLGQRLVEIGRELEEVTDIALAALAPGEKLMAAIEGGYIDGHGPSVLALAAARGVAMFVLGHNLKCEVRVYQPASVKLAATGSGKADKSQVARMVARRLGMKKEPNGDSGDALAIAIARAQDGSTS
jgi:crossover junction endodeoxyribonuclease RuvC